MANLVMGLGDAAPAFDAVALDGSRVAIPAASWTVISFLRYASCPMCNLRVRELIHGEPALESQGVRWIAVFHSPRERAARHVPPVAHAHVVADPGRRLYERYGVSHSWLGMLKSMLVPSFYWRFVKASALGFWGGAIDESFHSMPADFLVSPDGVIRLARYGTHIGDHASIPAILDSVREAKKDPEPFQVAKGTSRPLTVEGAR